MATVNPFKPTAGKIPPVLVGRQAVLDDFIEGLENGAGAPGRLVLVSGQRGYGKTVMLAEFRRAACDRGWEVFSETASSGLCERLVEALSSQRLKVSGASLSPSLDIPGVARASLGEVSFASPQASVLSLRRAVNDRLGKAKKGRGIVVTVDEAQAASVDDLVALATTFQHVLADQDMSNVPDAEKRGMVLALAGLPSLLDELVNNRVLTFLRRSQRQYLGEVPLPEARDAYFTAVRDAGKRIDRETAARAARAAEGHPYLIQLVGYYMWRAADLRVLKMLMWCRVGPMPWRPITKRCAHPCTTGFAAPSGSSLKLCRLTILSRRRCPRFRVAHDARQAGRASIGLASFASR